MLRRAGFLKLYPEYSERSFDAIACTRIIACSFNYSLVVQNLSELITNLAAVLDSDVKLISVVIKSSMFIKLSLSKEGFRM